MCRRLYKLHFQLLLLFQAYCKLISRVDTMKREAAVRGEGGDNTLNFIFIIKLSLVQRKHKGFRFG